MEHIGLDQARSLLRHLRMGEAVAVNVMKGGSSGGSYRIDLADGDPLVLKVYGLEEKLPLREAYASSRLAGLDVPATRYLAIDQSLTHLPVRFALTNYLSGEPAGSFRKDPDFADLHRQMGGLLRKLHAVPMAAYGHFDEHGVSTPTTTNADYMRALAAQAFGQFRKYGGDDALAGRLERIVEERAELFAHSRGAVFAHDDLHPNNVLAARDADGWLRISGLIDFGNARAADAIFDLAKTLFICEHEAPGSSSAILDGYGPIDHPDPAAVIWLYTLVHRVVMWWWLRHVGVIPDGQPHDLIDALRAMAEQR